MGVCTPQRYVSRVERIDLDALWSRGIRALLLDRDNTLVPRGTERAPESVIAWLNSAKEKGFLLSLISNNWHVDKVERSAAELACDHFIAFACKPLPFAIHVGLKQLNVSSSAAVFIGDQIFTDIAAGNLARLATILVKPQSREDLWYTKPFRALERCLLKNRKCEDCTL